MFKELKKIVSTLLIVIMLTVHMSLAFPRSVSASPFPNLSEVEQQVKGSLPNIDWEQVKLSVPDIDWEQVKGSVPNIDWEQVKGSIPNVDWEQLQGSIPNVDWDQIKESVFKINFQELQQAFTGNVQQVISKVDMAQVTQGLTDSGLSQKVASVIADTNSAVINQAQKYLDTTPDQFCRIYNNHVQGIDNFQWDALEEGARAVWKIMQAVNSAAGAGAGYAGIASAISQLSSEDAITAEARLLGSSATRAAATAIDDSQWDVLEENLGPIWIIMRTFWSASAAGAGSLSGYAGIASAISKLGFGTFITTLAKLLGSKAVGAAASAVVTSFVGGPLVMAILLVVATGLFDWGSSKTLEFTAQQFDGLAKEFCTQQSP